MARPSESRIPAVPSSPPQRARRQRMLAVATALASQREVDDVGMQEVADGADVAIATLYRYFPSKTQLFLGVMADQVDQIGEAMVVDPTQFDRPDQAVHAVLSRATRSFLDRPTLADAMMDSATAGHRDRAPEAEQVNRRLSDILLTAAGSRDPTRADRRLVRLVIQSWYGILQSALNGRLSPGQAERDLQLACRLLLAPMGDSSMAHSLGLDDEPRVLDPPGDVDDIPLSGTAAFRGTVRP